VTDSEQFYESILDFLDDPEEKRSVELVELVGVDGLIARYQPQAAADSPNSQVFLGHVVCEHVVAKQSTLAKLKERRAMKQVRLNGGAS
jgi:hypothetical protein